MAELRCVSCAEQAMYLWHGSSYCEFHFGMARDQENWRLRS